MIPILFLFLPILTCYVSAQHECPLPPSCNQTQFIDNEVKDYCQQHDAQMTSNNRCCISNNTVVGIDLRHCSIKELNISRPEFSQVEILDLRENEYEKFTAEDLIGLLKLNFLYLPLHMTCPGSNSAWYNVSTDNNMTFCFHQLDPCVSWNISCGEPENAKCNHMGPGSAQCECCPGYNGYKCLIKGEFPIAVFSTSVIIPTIVLSIVLWFVHGRDPYRKLQT